MQSCVLKYTFAKHFTIPAQTELIKWIHEAFVFLIFLIRLSFFNRNSQFLSKFCTILKFYEISSYSSLSWISNKCVPCFLYDFWVTSCCKKDIVFDMRFDYSHSNKPLCRCAILRLFFIINPKLSKLNLIFFRFVVYYWSLPNPFFQLWHIQKVLYIALISI